MLKQELIIALTNSELRADIPIPIARIIIAIESERACITAIIRVTANMQDVPPIMEHLMICPLYIFYTLKGEPRADRPIPKARIIIAKESERPRTAAITRATANTQDAPPAIRKVKIGCAVRRCGAEISWNQRPSCCVSELRSITHVSQRVRNLP